MSPSATDRSQRPSRQRGFAIILVLWLLVLLSAIALHLGSTGRTELQIATNIVATAKAEALADAGVTRAVFAVTDPNKETRWRMDGEPHRFALGEGYVGVVVRNENGKINPNIAPTPLLAALLRQVGVAQDGADSMAAAIAERVKPPPAAPTAAPGTSAANPRSRPFATIDDLRDVPGITPKLLNALRPHVSVYASLPLPDADAADDVVAAALADYQSRISQTPRPPQPQSAANLNRVTLSIVAEARVRSGATFIRSAVVRINDAAPQGYIVLRWRRGGAGAG